MTFKSFKDLEEERITNEEIAKMQLAIKPRQSPKRLIVDIPEEWHKTIKQRALDKNISIKAWVSRAIYNQMAKEQANGE